MIVWLREMRKGALVPEKYWSAILAKIVAQGVRDTEKHRDRERQRDRETETIPGISPLPKKQDFLSNIMFVL